MVASPDLRVQRAGKVELAYVERLLREAELPHEDVRDSDGRFLVAERDGERVGGGGLESHGDAALLRSLVVEPSVRGEGYGRALTEELIRLARADHARAVYLLTTTAASFFEQLGFERVERDAVPDALRASREFSELCPASATCMRRPLGEE
jgi:amino-acid N-acetyltransferase